MNAPLTGPTNELAKERNRAAAERTISAWIQNCLGLIGFGFAVDRIAVALEQRSQVAMVLPVEIAHWLGLLFVGLGIGLLAIASVQHRFAVQSIEREDYLFTPSAPLNLVVVSAVMLFGLVGLAIVGLQAGLLV